MRLKIEPSAHTPAEALVSESAPAAAYAADLRSLVAEGVAAAQAGDRARARILLTEATDKDPANSDAWMWLASISEYPEELLVFLNKVLECDPSNQRAIDWHASTCSLIAKNFVHRGVAAKDEGSNELAMECFDKAIEHDNNSEMAWFWRASIAEDESIVVESLNRVLEINPDNDDARSALASIEDARIEKRYLAVQRTVADGNWYEALNQLDEFLEDNLTSVSAWTLRSHISSSIEEKLLCYERVLSLDPSNEFASAGRDFLMALAAAVKPAIVEQPPVEEVAIDAPSAVEDIEAEASDDVDAIAMPTDIPLEDPRPAPTGLETRLDPPYFGEEAKVEPAPEYIPAGEPEVDPMIMAAVLAELEANAKADVLDPIEEVEPHFDGEIHISSDDEAEKVNAVGLAGEPDGSPFNDLAEDRKVEQPESPLFEESDKVLESTVIDFPAEDGSATGVEDFLKAYDERFSEEPVEAVRSAEELAAEAAIHETVSAPLISSVPEYECPYCAAEAAPQAFSCKDCRAILSLDDIDALLASSTGDLERIHDAVVEMEASWNTREFTSRELSDLGIGHLNLKNFDRGLRYLQEAARLDPDNVILVSQVNSLAIRLDEIHRREASVEAQSKGCSILVVDDSATVRKLISNKLEKHGHTVICAADGVEAMEAIDNFTPELVLLDITMPRMDGYQVCKMIRAHETAKDVPVVMISGKDGFFDKVRGKMSGCTGYITKPFGPETLMKALDTYLTQPSQPVVE
ncbi:MAG: response regulator [Acidobacteria bacterium OLB17]|nr:MAG: response regulator [Acidobacteria bacterium OLB17]MCZ2389892.1 response regulator [Acidobacteriota bacterium]